MEKTNTLDELNARFGIPGVLQFESGGGGLTRAAISTPLAAGHVYLHGAHVTHFQPRHKQPLLFLSSKSEFTSQKAIRGGVPICFPWFAAGKNGAAPVFHGFARTSEWKVVSTRLTEDFVEVSLMLTDDNHSRSIWPFPFQARYTIRIASQLHLALEVSNTGSKTFEFEEALHTYLQVADVRRVHVTGLEGTEYFDKALDMKKFAQGDKPVLFVGETDRIYLATPSLCTAHDVAGQQDISIRNSASRTTVVWNPWSEKAKEMVDLGPDEWTKMLCIETCNVKESAITLQPGQSHIMTATIGS